MTKREWSQLEAKEILGDSIEWHGKSVSGLGEWYIIKNTISYKMTRRLHDAGLNFSIHPNMTDGKTLLLVHWPRDDE